MSDFRDAKRIGLRIFRNIRDFLLSEKSKEFFLFLFFLVVAAGFWLIRTLDNEYETTIDIPVRLRSVPENVVITSDPPATVRIHVRDKGTLLLNYMMNKIFTPLNIEFMTGEGDHVQIPSSVFSPVISGQLASSTQVMSLSPDTLEYYYSTGQSKMVPVRFQGMASAGPHHYLSDTIFVPDSVRVYAPSAQLDTIKVAYTAPVDFPDIADTLRQKVRLNAGRGVKFVPDVSELTLAVDMYTEKSVEVELHGINFPPNKQLRAFPSKVLVTFQCGLSNFRNFTADDFHVFVSYEELLKLDNQKYTVQLRNIPSGVFNIRFNPAQVDFLIEQTEEREE